MHIYDSLGRREATGRGVSYLVNRATDTIGLDLSKATVAVQGFGNVGSVAALALAGYGARIVAVTDAGGGVYNAKGLNLWALENHAVENKTVAGFALSLGIRRVQGPKRVRGLFP